MIIRKIPWYWIFATCWCRLLRWDPSVRVEFFVLSCEDLSGLGYEETFSSAGLSVGSSLQLLSASLDKTAMLEALCTSPLNRRDESGYPIYCETMLQNLLQLPDANVTLVLKRVCDLVRSYHTAGSWKTGLVRSILTLHLELSEAKHIETALPLALMRSESSQIPTTLTSRFCLLQSLWIYYNRMLATITELQEQLTYWYVH
jgi:hypothetical protein